MKPKIGDWLVDTEATKFIRLHHVVTITEKSIYYDALVIDAERLSFVFERYYGTPIEQFQQRSYELASDSDFQSVVMRLWNCKTIAWEERG
jgi:hypothetical protein